MKILILDGSINSDPLAASIRTALTDELCARGADAEYVLVSGKKIANCQGDFFCWVRSPGLCAINDDNRVIARSFMNSDLVVFLTPVTFGGYSSRLKRAVDHLIQNVLPFFAMINGEVHHRRRYRRYPRLLVIGWLPQADAASEAIFHHLVYRNGLNMHAPSAISGVIYSSHAAGEVRKSIKNLLEQVFSDKKRAKAALPVANELPSVSESVAARRALLLVGSPRGRLSTSQALGAYLFDQLVSQGVQTETIRLYTMLRSETQMRTLLATISAADLVTLAFPLYVDSLPGPVMRVLEDIARHRRENPLITASVSV